MLKKFIAHSLVFSLVFNNLAFATQSIIELDFKDSQTPQRLHVIPRMSNVGDVSHIEIDTEQKQAAVYLKEKQEEALDEVEKNSSQGGDVPVNAKPVILHNHNINNLPWELEPEKLTLFILNHTAWLTPLDEVHYKLEFRGGLLGGMKPWGGGKKELVVNVYPKGVDCGGRNDWPKGTIGDKYCRNDGNGLGGNFGVQVFNKPYVPPVDKEWEKYCEKALNPFGNQKIPYIPAIEDKKPDLKKVNINPVKAPQIKVDNKKIHQAVGKEVREVAQPLINKFDKYQVRGIVQKIPDIVMETLASYRGGEISQKTLDEIVRNIGLRIDPMMKQTGLFRILKPNDYYRILDKDRRWCGKSVDEVSRKAVAQAYAGLKKQYDEELEKFKKSQKIEEEKLEKAKKEQAIKEEQQKKIQEEKQAKIVFELQKKTENPLLYADYEHMKHLQHLINTDSWENVFKYADKAGISREDVLKIDRLEKMTFEGFMKKTNPFYESYEHKKHLQQLINTDSWENVFKYADKAGISREDVLKVDRLEKMTFTGFMQKTNPFYGNYEKVKHIQTLINTTTWKAVYDYAEKQEFTTEEVRYVNSRRGENITFDGYMKEVFDDQMLEDWGAKDWREVVKLIQVGKMQKTDPMAPHDYFDLEGKMGGVGMMGGGSGGGKLGWNRLLGKGKINPQNIVQHKYNYHERIRARAVEDPKGHNFPYRFDDAILKSKPTLQKDGSLLYRKEGLLNGKEGFFEIAINTETNTIFHRCFIGK